MSIAHHRKKRPEQVRQQLLDVAAQISARSGVNTLTLDAVALAAGVSKGGLLHHFPSKAALLDGLFDELGDAFDAAVEERMRNDPMPRGRFTRAYVDVIFSHDDGKGSERWQVLTMAVLAEPHLRERWRVWMTSRTEAFVGTDSSAGCVLARFAADGVWLADLLNSHDFDAESRSALLLQLHALSRQ